MRTGPGTKIEVPGARQQRHAHSSSGGPHSTPTCAQIPPAVPSHSSPGSIWLFPHSGGSVVTVVVVLVVVVGVAQPPATHASQQLGAFPTHACSPDGGRHLVASDFLVQRVSPRTFVRQQVTKPGRPHVERAAQATTARRHSLDRPPVARATSPTHRTYAPWLGAAAHRHAISALARAVATAAGSVQVASATAGAKRPVTHRPTSDVRARPFMDRDGVKEALEVPLVARLPPRRARRQEQTCLPTV